MKNNLVILLLSSLLVLQTAHAASVEQTLTFTSTRSLLLVHINVDGRDLLLIFDTGAERTLINSPKESVERKATVRVDTKTFDTRLAFVDLAGTDIAKTHADGVLGQDILRKFDFVKIDYASHTITMW